MVSFEQRAFKTKFGKAILWITLFSMAGGSLIFSPIFKRFGGSGGGAPQIGNINGIPLTILQFRQKVAHEAERIEFLRQQMGPRAEMMMRMMGLSTDPKEIALQALITDSLLDQVVDKLHINLSDEVIGRKLQEPMYVVNELRDLVPYSILDQRGVINPSMLRYYLQTHGISFADFENSLVRGISRLLVRNLITMSAYVSNEDLKEAFAQRVTSRDYSILTLDLDSFVKKARMQAATQEQLNAFFKEQNSASKKYWAAEKRTATVIEFKPEQFGITLSDNDIERYYQEHKQAYVESPVQVQIRRILIKADQGMSQAQARETIDMIKKELAEHPDHFAQLAQKYSKDSSSASKGGLLGFFKKGDLDPSIERAAFRLQNDNDISDIITTENAFEIIQRVSRKPTSYKSLDAVKNEIKASVAKERFQDLFNKEARAVVNQTRSLPNGIADFAKNRNATQKSLTFNKKDSAPLAQKVFKSPVDEWTIHTDANGNGLLIKTAAIEKAAEQPLAAVQKQVEDDFYVQKGQELLKQALATAQAKAATASLASLKTELGGSVQTTGMVSPTDKETVEALENKKLPLRDMFNLAKAGSVAVLDQGDQAYIIKVDTVKPFDEQLFREKTAELKAQLLEEQQDLIYQGYIASLARHATIKLIQENEYQDQRIPLEDLPL